MKTAKITLINIKDSDAWCELATKLKYEDFKKENPDLDEDELSDKFYREVISKKFMYGEYGALELHVDENFNIVGGKII